MSGLFPEPTDNGNGGNEGDPSNPQVTQTGPVVLTGPPTGIPSPDSTHADPHTLPRPQNTGPPSNTYLAYNAVATFDLRGGCTLSNGTHSYQQFGCVPLVPAGSGKSGSNTGAIAAAVVFALLFAGMATILGCVIWRRKKRGVVSYGNGNAYNDPVPYPMKSLGPSHGQQDQSATISSLQSQLSTANARLNDLQASLLTGGGGSTIPSGAAAAGLVTLPPSCPTPPSIDDRQISTALSQITNDIKAYASNFYRGGTPIPASSISGELHQLLEESMEAWDSLLPDQKGRILLVRTVVGELIRRAWVEGDFLGRKLGRITVAERELITSGLPAAQVHQYRLSVLGPLLNTPALSQGVRDTAVQQLAEKITTLLAPFSPQGGNPNTSPTTVRFLTTTLMSVSGLYFTLAPQLAWYTLVPYVSLQQPERTEMEAVYEHGTCEDVEQRFEIRGDGRGGEWSEAEGRRIRGFVFAACVKYGDGRGGGWVEKGGKTGAGRGALVVGKARVVVE